MIDLAGVRVLVAGAGLAGLSAARELSRAGAHVDLVDARDRLGGRVWTRRDANTSLHVEAGGEFIDGEHAEIRALARSLRVPLVRILRDGFGLAVRYGRRLHVGRSQSAEWRALRAHLKPAVDALHTIDDDWDEPVARALGRRSVDDLLRATKAPPRLMAMAAALNGFYLADPDCLSALVLVEQNLGGTPPGQATFYRVKGGNDRLVTALSRRVRGRTLTRHVLRALRQHGRRVRATVEGADGRLTELTADYAIVTLPASTLRDCHFEPALPAFQQDALAALEYGAATKAFLRFDRPWWRRRGRPRAFGTNLPIGAFWESAEDQRPHAVLTFLAGGSTSHTLASLAGSGPSGVAAHLRWLGTPPTARLAAPTVSWTDDPWARGGYAVFSPRFDPALRDALAMSHGRIAFAGEHTSRRWQGFMNGAVESGTHAATVVAQLHRLGIWASAD